MEKGDSRYRQNEKAKAHMKRYFEGAAEDMQVI